MPQTPLLAGRVDPRPVKPPAMGLLASCAFPTDGSDYETADQGAPGAEGSRVHWVRGFSYMPEVCSAGQIMDPNGATQPSASAEETKIDVYPFAVQGSIKMSTFEAETPELLQEAVDKATRSYYACEQQVIERELFAGAQSVAAGWGNRYLADAGAALIEGDRLIGYRTALAVLEHYIAGGTCGQQGMIHARADTVTFWVSEHLVRRQGNLLLTELGTIIVAGGGYDGRAPATGDVGLDPAHAGKVPSADSAWAYATTMVDVRRGEFLAEQTMTERVQASATTNAASNLLTTRVTRPCAVTWGCLHGAVHVDHTTALTTTGS